MAEERAVADRVARFMGFAALGALGTVQHLAQTCLAGIDGADAEIVAEESLCLVAIATARAAEVGLRNQPEVGAAVVPALVALPFTYHDYLIGGAVIAREDTSMVEASRDTYDRLLRKNEFYATHLPAGQFPGERTLEDKMAFWMGRISPPGLPDMPQDRLKKLDLIPILLTHLKLILALARQGQAEA